MEIKEKDFILLDSNPLSVDYVCNYKESSKQTALSIVDMIVKLTSKEIMFLYIGEEDE